MNQKLLTWRHHHKQLATDLWTRNIFILNFATNQKVFFRSRTHLGVLKPPFCDIHYPPAIKTCLPAAFLLRPRKDFTSDVFFPQKTRGTLPRHPPCLSRPCQPRCRHWLRGRGRASSAQDGVPRSILCRLADWISFSSHITRVSRVFGTDTCAYVAFTNDSNFVGNCRRSGGNALVKLHVKLL